MTYFRSECKDYREHPVVNFEVASSDSLRDTKKSFRDGGGGRISFHSSGNVTYTVTAMTPDLLEAGTDADVYMTIHGDTGRSTGEIYLDTPYDDFECGRSVTQ